MAASDAQAIVALIDVPTALTGFLLVMRLPGTSGNSQDSSGKWVVSVPGVDGAAVGPLLESVQTWLRQEGIAETRVRVGNAVHDVRADRTDRRHASDDEGSASSSGTNRQARV